MLIPAIDLQQGAVVQLVQGERLAIRDDDIFKWVRRFERFPKVQVIDLDAAMGKGDNLAIVRQIAPALACRVGGGIRTVERARDVLAAGAKQVFVTMEHLTKKGESKLVERCTYPLTGVKCVTRVYTDLAVIDVTPGGLAVREMVDGLSLDELRRITGVPLAPGAALELASRA